MRSVYHCASWRGPSQQLLAVRSLVHYGTLYHLLLGFSLSNNNSSSNSKKQAEKKNSISGQARILFWKREVCGSIPSRPSKSLAVVEPGGDVLRAGLAGVYLGTWVGVQQSLRQGGTPGAACCMPALRAVPIGDQGHPPASIQSAGLRASLFHRNKGGCGS